MDRLLDDSFIILESLASPGDQLTEGIARKLTPNGTGVPRRAQECRRSPGQAPQAPGLKRTRVNLPAILLVKSPGYSIMRRPPRNPWPARGPASPSLLTRPAPDRPRARERGFVTRGCS